MIDFEEILKMMGQSGMGQGGQPSLGPDPLPTPGAAPGQGAGPPAAQPPPGMAAPNQYHPAGLKPPSGLPDPISGGSPFAAYGDRFRSAMTESQPGANGQPGQSLLDQGAGKFGQSLAGKIAGPGGQKNLQTAGTGHVPQPQNAMGARMPQPSPFAAMPSVSQLGASPKPPGSALMAGAGDRESQRAALMNSSSGGSVHSLARRIIG